MNVFVSVIIATHNRCEQLTKVLDDLLNQETDGRFSFEILVVDNNSQDQTKVVVNEHLNRVPADCWRLQYLFEPRQGKPYALNRGIQEAKGEILAFTDDDVILDPHWLKEIRTCFEKYRCDGVGGRVLPLYPPQTAAWIKDNPHELAGAVVICDFGEGTKQFDPEMGKLIGANFAFKREIFKECGLFKTDLIVGKIAIGEDTEFIQRSWKAKKKLYYCGPALVRHPIDLKRLSLRFLARWHFQLGKIAAKSEHEELKEKLVSWKGIPQYLFRGVVVNFILLTLFFWHRRKFFKYFRGFFRKIGMIAEYRAMRQKGKGAGHAQG